MSVLEVEQGAPVGDKAQEMINLVHYVVKYLLKDGADCSDDMTSMSISILDRVVAEPGAGAVARLSALNVLAVIHQYRGEMELLAAAQAKSEALAIEVERDIEGEVEIAYG